MDNFSETLRSSRRKAGLSQADCAHLMGISASHVARLESGRSTPSIADLCGVALIFGRTLEGLSGDLFTDCARRIRDRLFDLPEARGQGLAQFNRVSSLQALGDRLDDLIGVYGS